MDSPRDVVEGFRRAWAAPRLAGFMALLHPEVVLLQPIVPPIRGAAAARADFARLLAWLPDVRGEVDTAAIAGDTALIAWRMRFILGRRPLEVAMVDRLEIADGLIREREAYFDSLRLALRIARSPAAIVGFLRYRGVLPARP